MTSKGMEQFLGYLSDNRVQNLNNLVYVFNARKSSLQAAKQKMQTVFRNNATKIWDAKPSLFNYTFSGLPVGRNTFKAFLDSINETHPLYNFVIVN